MRISPILTVALVSLGLAACSSNRAPSYSQASATAMMDPTPCGAARFSNLIGQPLTALPSDQIPGTMRITLPNQPRPAAQMPMRLTVALNESNRISGLSCG